MISKSDGLRDDVTLVVERDRLRFFDAECREIPIGPQNDRWAQDSVKDLSTKLSLLDWLHDRFPCDGAAHPGAVGSKRPAASFYPG